MVKIKARAKINLYLRVGDRRPDGYHDIQTVFHSIDLADTLEIEAAPSLEVTCSSAHIAGGPENLAHRAALLLAREAGINAGARIHIHKVIPSQAGLGGGSADAAAALVALNRLWDLELSSDALERIAKSLGADVPFCIRGGAAYAEGVGERLRVLQPIHAGALVVVKPTVSVSTATAYAMLDAAPRIGSPAPDRLLEVFQHRQLDKLESLIYNDFQDVVLSHHPEIARAFAALRMFTEHVLLCGSGSAIFGLVENRTAALQAQTFLSAQGWEAYATTFASTGSEYVKGFG